MLNFQQSIILRSLTINIALLLLPALAWSQEQDTVKLEKKSFIPTGIRVGTDVLSIIRSNSSDTFTGWEVNGDVDFGRYYLAVDVGSWSRDLPSEDDHYTNEGRYFRAGIDVNFLLKDPDKNLFFLGARYGRGVFSENFVVHVEDPVWGVVDEVYTNNDVTARWFELTGGLKVKIWKVIWLGYTARYKFGLSTGSTPLMLPHDVPGYGRTDRESTWGFNYHIFVRLPVRKVK